MDDRSNPGSKTRRVDVDWLRVFATYLLFPFHAAMVFNPAPFYHVRNADLSIGMLAFAGFVSLWHMPLFFLLAGWSAASSLELRGPRAFLRERLHRLGVPLVAGCVLLVPVIKYLELRSGLDLNHTGLRVAAEHQDTIRLLIPGGLPVAPPFHASFLGFLPTFFTQLDRFTWSHLWFVAYLLTFTILYLPLFVRLLRSREWFKGERSPLWVYAPILPLAVIQVTMRERWPGLKTSLRIEKKEGHQSMPAFEVSPNARIVRTINSAYRAVRGEAQPTGAILPPGFYGTDAGHFHAKLGMEGIVCGPGGRYNTMPDERVDIIDYLDMIRIYMLCILDICEEA